MRVATLTQAIFACFESGGTLGAVADVALKIVDYQLLRVVHIADDEGRFDNLGLAGHDVGAGQTWLTPRRGPARSFYGDGVRVDIVLG
jgi:hypothetical protein